MATAAQEINTYRLDPEQRGLESTNFEDSLRRKIVGQEEAVRAVADLYQSFRAGLNSPSRPVGNLLFLGPTGTGKTRVAEATAEVLVGHSKALIRIDCAEFQHSHEISKLLGSPPGYLGYRDTYVPITQETLAEYHRDELKLSLLLFDEIEKASEALWQLLLGILDKAALKLGDGRQVDLSQTIIFMSSNLGGRKIMEMLSGKIGFAGTIAEEQPRMERKTERAATEAAKRHFAPEFMNRIDKVVVFHPLSSDQLEQVLKIELDMVQQRVLQTGKVRFRFELTPNARMFLLVEGTDVNYGARHLNRAVERHLVHPLANLISSEQVSVGDVISIDWVPGHSALTFTKCPEKANLQAVKPLSSPISRRTVSLGNGAAARPDVINLPRRLTRM